MYEKNITRIFFPALFFLSLFVVLVSGSIVEPELYTDNPNCCDLGFCGSSFKTETPPWDREYSLGGGMINISMINSTHFNFISTVPIKALIVKGGPNSTVYIYGSTVLSDTVLGTPFNPNSKKFCDISHLEICYLNSAPVPEFPSPIFPVFIISGFVAIAGICSYMTDKKNLKK
ncbi:hypothetical protein F1737_05275 [Methanoplanus sp. FWC-SCC4]|uniref:Uncharacterized protein n=1 Tax=Methanochimaera problematica TaxID=2609417 RepID=A0AA97FDC8_9EURY|nr:hypothetical protein [Methanoplanus sp. FWC-SCC4]WOF16159.1 hypothetical protein F1737_05275 [Methanoplanus sp. FWC-SCC4]